MISAIFVVNSAGLKLYSKVYDSNIVVDDLLLVSILSAIQMYAEKAIDENIRSIEFDRMHIIYRIPEKLDQGGIMIVIIAEEMNTTIMLQANHIINLIRKRLPDSIDILNFVQVDNRNAEILIDLENEINMLINLSSDDLEQIQKDTHIQFLEKLLNKIAKRVPKKTLMIDSRIMINSQKSFCVDPSISKEDCEKIQNKLRQGISRLYGSKIFDETLRELD